VSELGYNYLDTRFSGTSATPLSTDNNALMDEFFLPQDLGVATSLEQSELRSYFQKL
jgi:hypothetical protein